MIEIALLAIAVLVITLTLGVPLPYCFGAALMVMYFIGDVTMKGMMLWGVQQLGNPILLAASSTGQSPPAPKAPHKRR